MPEQSATSELPVICRISKPHGPGHGGAFFVRELTEDEGEPRVCKKLDDLRACDSLAHDWNVVRAIFEECPVDDDFYRYCLGAFAISERARRIIEPLTGEQVEYLPVKVVGIRDIDDGPVRPLPPEEQRTLYIVRPLELARLSAAAKFEDLGIMLIVHKYAFDWDSMEGRHWFHISGDFNSLVSAELRSAIEQAGLKGLTFDKPIKYAIGAKARSVPRKRVLTAPRPPALEGEQRAVTPELWDSWMAHWKWIGKAIRARDGFDTPVSASRPLTPKQLKALEARLGFRLPAEFAKVLTQHAGSVRLSWHIPEGHLDALPVDLWDISRGGGGGLRSGKEGDCLWDSQQLPEFHDYMQKWIESVSAETAEHFRLRHKLPFMTDGSGNFLALDGSAGPDNWPVVWLSHDDASEHLIRLGENFVDFITRWSRLGCPGPDLYQIEPFYNRRSRQISDSGRLAKRWLRWLEQGK